MVKPPSTRARDLAQKRERRSAILASARSLLTEGPYAAITMAQVAERAGLAKGTSYLYFRSKEELFLALLEQELEQWFTTIEKELDGLKGSQQREAVRRILVEATLARPRLPRLLVLLHGSLAARLPESVAHGFLLELLRRGERLGRALERRLGFLPPGAGLGLVQRIQALIAGIQPMAEPAPALAGPLQYPGLEALKLDFRQELGEGLQALLMGMERQAEHK